MVFQVTTHLEVTDVIKQKKNEKISVCRGIIIQILKFCSPVVENATTNALNRCIEEHMFPKILETT